MQNYKKSEHIIDVFGDFGVFLKDDKCCGKMYAVCSIEKEIYFFNLPNTLITLSLGENNNTH